MNLHDVTVIAIVQTISSDRVVYEPRFVLNQCRAMPDFLRLGMASITLLFAISVIIAYGQPFNTLPYVKRFYIVNRLRAGRLGLTRNFIRFYDSLTIYVSAWLIKW